MIAEELIVKIRAEVDKAVRDMKKAETQSDKSTVSFKKMAAAMGIGNIASQAFTKGIAAVSKLISDSSKAASDAEETFAKFETVFRDLGDSGPQTMNDLADSFNLANSTAARLLGNTGDLLTGFGLTQEAALELSDETTRLAIDLASFTNAQGGAEAVSRALTAAYAGERESLKTYGIVMTEADVQARMLKNEMEGLTFESDRQARAFATLELAQEQSKNAIGDYARTADSTANTQRQLNETMIEFKEVLGDSVNDGVTPLRRALIGLFEDINAEAQGQSLFDDLLAAGPSGRSLEQIERAKRLIEETIEIEARRGGSAADRQISKLYEQLGVLDDMVETENNRAEAMEYANGLIERGARVREEAAAAAEREAEAQERLQLLQERWAEDRSTLESVYSQTLEGQREEIQKTIKLFEGMVAQSDPVRNRLAVSIDYLRQRLAALNDEADDTGEDMKGSIMSFGDDIGSAISTIAGSDMSSPAEAFANEWERAFEQINDEAQGGFYGGMQQAANKIMTVWNNGLSQIGGMAMQTFSMMSQAANARSQNAIANVQAEVDALSDRHEREVAWAEAAGASEEELAQMHAEQLEEQQAAEERLDRKKKKIKKEQFRREKALSIAQTIMNTAQAVVGFLANPGGIPGVALSSTAGLIGSAQLAIIQSTPPPAFERGGSFVTNGPQTIQVGDGQSPRERVTVEPLTGPYARGGNRSNVTINISGAIGGQEEVAVWVNEGIRRASARGAI